MDEFVIQQKNEGLLTAISAVIKLIDNISDREAAIELEDSVASAEVSKTYLEYVKSFPELAQLIEERYTGPTINLETLLKLPSDSLGYLFAFKMKAINLDIEYFIKDRSNVTKVDEEIAYLRLLMRKTHDIWHLVTGFDVTLGGELGVKGFELAQYHSPLSVFAVVIVLLTAINNAKEMNSRIEQFIRGYHMGLKSKLLLAEKWEERWEQPLTEVRSELNIEPYES